MEMEALANTYICKNIQVPYFPKYGRGVNYVQMASDQALNWTRRSFEIQKTVL